MEKEPITVTGLEKLKTELIFLKEKKRPEIITAISEARSHGDLKENAEYHAAKEQQSLNEGRIEEINDVIARANVIDVSKLDNDGKVISIEEKPENPKSNNAIVGVYVFDGTVIDKIKTLKPSARGEYEIVDLCDLYITENNCMNIPLKGWWIDAGTPERIEELESNLL